MTTWTLPLKNTGTDTYQAKNTAVYTNPNKSLSPVDTFDLLIDNTFFFLIDNTFHLLIGGSSGGGLLDWTNEVKH